jgi:hypothetical protein
MHEEMGVIHSNKEKVLPKVFNMVDLGCLQLWRFLGHTRSELHSKGRKQTGSDGQCMASIEA